MSWAEEDWTVGLSGRVLQKVKELQVHQERLSRENKQKQLQLDNIHISLEKQTGKYEEVRGELQSVQRELRSTREEAKTAVTCNGRLTQEVQTKQAQVCSLEGQLDAARTLNNKLTQEIKRLEAELEKLQNSSRLADTTLFSTPSWNTPSPWEHNAGREEETSGQRDEAAGRAHHGRRLHFSDNATPSLPRQQQKSTPHRHPSNQSDTFSTPVGAFPWDREDSRPSARRRHQPSPQTPPQDVAVQDQPEKGDRGKAQTAGTDISSSELRSRISSLEEELSVKARSLKSIQNEQMQSKKELAAKELSLQRARDELSAAQTRISQDGDRVSAAELRLKQLQEELKCQRQNADSSRLQHQQRTKELEKQHQRDLTELQKERQGLERQHQQEVNKLNQELQHARTQHNALQAQADKLLLQKQALDKDLDSLKEKLRWTEEQLKESQKKEAQTQVKLTEAVREAEGAAVSLEQSRKRERALEEEGRRLSEERADALRLLKELQEQKPVPAPPSQPVQLCSASQSFTPQAAPPSRTQTKRPATTRAEHKRVGEEDIRDGERSEVTAHYPSDREPGEGIDSEHITAFTPLSSECLEKDGHDRKMNEEENKSRSEAVTWNTSETSPPSLSAPGSLSTTSGDADRVTNAEPSPGFSVSERSIPSKDLKKENAMLRSELQDVREELQKRLEDLETQRRAEAETRARLKQLSRKQANQAVDKEEKHKEWKAQLEGERAETERLRKTIAALEAEVESRKQETDTGEREDEEDDNREQQDRESEMIELNIQLKKQLAEVKAQLALEREERKQEEEKNYITNTDTDVKEELSRRVVELTAEVEELQQRIKEESKDEEKLPSAHSPLTYLTLHDDELNSNIVCCDNKLLPSPEQHLLFCQSTNQRNTIVSQAPAEVIQEGGRAIVPQHAPLSDPAALINTDLHSSDLTKEVEHLKRENAKETERANQYQEKLEALQSQVTRQTLQLTTAFENQTQHISGLLAELQEKESAFLRQEEQMLQYKKELDALRTTKKEEEEVKMERTVGEGEKGEISGASAQMSELIPKCPREGPVTSKASQSEPDVDLNEQEDETPPKIGTCEAETPDEDHKALQSEERCDSAYLNQTVTTEDQSGQKEGTAETIPELLALRLENQLLKQRIEDFNVSGTRNSPLQMLSENQEDAIEQSQNSEPDDVSFLENGSTCNGQIVVLAEDEESLLLNVKRSEVEGQPLEMMDSKTTEEDLEEVSQVNHLEQQVEALQVKIIALSEEMRQQNEELAMWRLSSQPAPTFDSNEQPETLEQVDETTRSPAQTLAAHTRVQSPTPGPQRRPESITVIREDDLLLSCSSSKLQGRMLFSRLQNDNLPEPKSLQAPRKSSALQEYKQDTANMDQESEKENQEFVLQQSAAAPTQHKGKKGAEVVPVKTAQLHAAKDPHKGSGGSLRDTECHAAKPNAKSTSCGETDDTSTASKSVDRAVGADVRSVCVQTEERPYPRCAPTLCATTQTEEEEDDEEELVESPPVSPVSLTRGAESDNKMLFAGSFPIPADPARLAERIRRNRTQLSAAFDDTEYEPYGLPEVVMKGFADIPTGPSCPYIVRRGLLGTTVVPVSQEDSGNKEETD